MMRVENNVAYQGERTGETQPRAEQIRQAERRQEERPRVERQAPVRPEGTRGTIIDTFA